ncbi:MAG: type IV pilus assembly protein PilM [Patescibacteria group bacterium]|nr:type IV pilus assembly protein PilM [Patescibacteria group bacterium]
MLELFKLKPESFSLDISDLSLKIINLKKGRRGLSLASFGEQDIAPGIIRGGEIIKENDLAEIIKVVVEKVKGEKLKTRYVVASLPEEKAFFQVIQMPKIQKEDLKSAVIYEAENYIPLPIENVYLDFQIIKPIQDGLDHFDILISAMPKLTVDSYVSSLKLAGLEPLVLEVESLAIIRALIKGGITTHPTLLIDFGATRTSFIIFSGRSLRFTSSISVSSSNFTEIISKSLGISLTKAEELKIRHGLEEKIKIKKEGPSKKEKERGKVFEALIPVLVDLTQQIKKHLYYYQTHDSHEHLSSVKKIETSSLTKQTNIKGVSKILLCGGGSNLKGLPEFLSLELKIPVELADPWVNVLAKDPGILEVPSRESLGYTTAIGLALRENTK